MIVAFWIICGIAAAYIAEQKDKSPMRWLFLGFLLGPFALLMVGFAPGRRKTPMHILRKCPYCAEDIQWRARFCPHCGHELPPPGELQTTVARAYLVTRKRLGRGAREADIIDDLAAQGIPDAGIVALLAAKSRHDRAKS